VTFTWYAILGGFLLSLLLTFVLWKRDFLKVSPKWFPKYPFPARGERHYYLLTTKGLEGEEKAIFKRDKIIEAEVPKWMAKPPFSHVICFLIVCIGLGVIILAVAGLLKVII